MGAIKRIQLEINGTCPRSCSECLPAGLKTGAMLSLKALEPLALEWAAAGIEAITLAGFGSSVAHPEFPDILDCLSNRFRVAVVCRPSEVAQCLTATQVIVSVQTYEDARQLDQVLASTRPTCQVSTHTITSPFILKELDWILVCLLNNRWISRVNVADALKLCNDPAHIRAIRECSKPRLEVISMLDKARRERYRGDIITQCLEGHFPEKCAFHDDLIYVDASLRIRLCCHQPTLGALGNLNSETLPEALKTVAIFQANWRQHPACMKCPDTGGSHA